MKYNKCELISAFCIERKSNVLLLYLFLFLSPARALLFSFTAIEINWTLNKKWMRQVKCIYIFRSFGMSSTVYSRFFPLIHFCFVFTNFLVIFITNSCNERQAYHHYRSKSQVKTEEMNTASVTEWIYFGCRLMFIAQQKEQYFYMCKRAIYSTEFKVNAPRPKKYISDW